MLIIKTLFQLEYVGELYIGGVQVGRGYLNRRELTEERFLVLDNGE